MSTSIFKIKSKFNLINLFEYLQLNRCYEISYGSLKLFEYLNITTEKYKILNKVKKLINPSYEINKYIENIEKIHTKENYKNKNLEINESKYIYKRLVFGMLSHSSFNINLFVENESTLDLISHIYNWNLIISPIFLNYLCSLDEKHQNHKLFVLNLHKNHISQISFLGFEDKYSLNIKAINQIFFFLQKIFEIKEENFFKKNNSEKDNKKNEKYHINESHNIKSIYFSFNSKSLLEIFFKGLIDVISLNKIKNCYIGGDPLNAFQFQEIINFISKNMKSLENLKINKLTSDKIHFSYLTTLFTKKDDNIEKLEIDDMLTATDFFQILKIKSHPFKELKINIFTKERDINWDFLEKSLDSLEVLEIKLIAINNYKNLDKIINIINKMKILKDIKIIGGFEISQLFNLKNIEKIDSLNIDINTTKENIDLYNSKILNYFTNFKSLKSLYLAKRSTFNVYNKFYIFYFPIKLTCIHLINIDANSLLFLLNINKQNLIYIEEFKIENVLFLENEFFNLIKIFKEFKSLIRLSLNKIKLPSINEIKDSIFNYIDLIFKNIPYLVELDVSNNYMFFDKYVFEKIEKSLPKTLLSLKIFSDNTSIKRKDLQFLLELFKEILDLNNNTLIISEETLYGIYFETKENYLSCNLQNNYLYLKDMN